MTKKNRELLIKKTSELYRAFQDFERTVNDTNADVPNYYGRQMIQDLNPILVAATVGGEIAERPNT